jgi:hypothetical protein
MHKVVYCKIVPPSRWIYRAFQLACKLSWIWFPSKKQCHAAQHTHTHPTSITQRTSEQGQDLSHRKSATQASSNPSNLRDTSQPLIQVLDKGSRCARSILHTLKQFSKGCTATRDTNDQTSAGPHSWSCIYLDPTRWGMHRHTHTQTHTPLAAGPAYTHKQAALTPQTLAKQQTPCQTTSSHLLTAKYNFLQTAPPSQRRQLHC